MQAIIELAGSGEVETIANFPDGYTSPLEIQLDELSRLRISVTGYNDSTRVLAGMLELQPYELSETSTLIFARADVSAEMLEKGDFFSQPFVNQIGRSTLSLEHDGEIFQLEVQLKSTKVKEEEVYGWLNKICEEFGKNISAHMSVYGAHNEERLTGLHETQSIDQFSYGVSDMGASIRIPIGTIEDGWKGRLEDRRPASNGDPYKIGAVIISTTKSAYN